MAIWIALRCKVGATLAASAVAMEVTVAEWGPLVAVIVIVRVISCVKTVVVAMQREITPGTGIAVGLPGRAPLAKGAWGSLPVLLAL